MYLAIKGEPKMEKPFDPQALVEKLKAKGMSVAEEGVKISFIAIVEWLEESVVLTPGKYDDFAIPVLEALKPIVLDQIKKIDGQV
jgi:hypothetical protein